MARASRWDAMLERLERSRKVFLLGLVIAFAVEIVVDWNATFYEINVLRAQLGEKATNVAAILRLAVEESLARGKLARVGQLASRVCVDPEVAAVRVADARGVM